MPQHNFPWTGGEAPTFDEVRNKPAAYPPVTATATVVGGVKQAPLQADSVATTVAGVVSDFNALLAKLRGAGVIASS